MLLATDGAIELLNEKREMFGRERLERLLAENRHLPATEILGVIREAITGHHDGERPPDDVTMLILERKLDGSGGE